MMTKDHEYLYPYSAQEAKKRNQLPMWRESYHANVEMCIRDSTSAVLASAVTAWKVSLYTVSPFFL